MFRNYSQNQTRIVNHIGISDWDEIVCIFAGLKKKEVLEILDEMDPHNADNTTVANLIVKEMPVYLTVAQVAQISGYSEATIKNRCAGSRCNEKDKIKEARRVGQRTWFIPAKIARKIIKPKP